MKRALLAGAAALALSAWSAAPAKAQLTTLCVNCSDEVMDVARQAENMIQWGYQLRGMAAQLAALAHTTSVQGAAGIAGGLARQVVPLSGRMSALMNGRNGTWGTADARMAEDKVYFADDGTEMDEEMKRRARVSANAKAQAEAVYADIDAQIDELDASRAAVEGAEDVTAVSALAAGVALAKHRLDASRGQLEQVRLMLAADDRVTAQRYEQMWRRDTDDFLAKTSSALGGW